MITIKDGSKTFQLFDSKYLKATISIKIVLLLFLLFNTLDIITTYIILSLGGIEVNPLAKIIVYSGLWSMILAKLIMCTIFGYLALFVIAVRKYIGIPLIWGATGLYIGVVLSNTMQIISFYTL
jgi:hypothetical protein